MADQTVRMVSPDKKDVTDVPIDQVEHFKALGATVVEPPPPPTLGRRLAKGALDSLPGIGAVVGGVISTPETGGAATIPGIALGAGAGRGIRDLIGHYSGLDEPTSPMQKAFNIAGDTAMTGATAAILPGALAAAKTPIQTMREASEHFGSAMPASIQKLGKLLPSLPKPPAAIPEFASGWGGTAETAGSLSASDKAMLARQGYSPELIQRVEQAAMTRGATPPAPMPSPMARPMARPMAPAPMRPPMTVAPSSPMQPPTATMPPLGAQPLPLYPSAGTVKGVTSNALETASNVALAAGHWDEAERLIGQSLQSFFQGSGGPMVGIMAAAIAHKARQVVEPLRADPAFQRAAPAKQQQMIQQALRQPGARGSLTNALRS